MAGSFQPNSDMDRIYMTKIKGGKGLRSIRTLYESRIISLWQHLLRNANRNEILGYVSGCEQAYIIRVGIELLINNDITQTPDPKPKSLSTSEVYKSKSKGTGAAVHKQENAGMILQKAAAAE